MNDCKVGSYNSPSVHISTGDPVLHVYTMERYGQLADQAAARLTNLGFTNVSFFIGDGSLGWPEEAPFDRILVTAASPRGAPPLAM